MPKPITVALALLVLSMIATAQVNIIAWNPTTAGISMVYPYIDGVAFPITWESTCNMPCTSTSGYSFSTFATLIAPWVSGAYSTCGASLPGRGSGHPCIIVIDARAVSNPFSNSDTPSWVFGGATQDVAFCGSVGPPATGYYGSTTGTPPNTVSPPPSPGGYSNITTSNCVGPMGNVLCTAATLATGIPAIWETPFQNAVQSWWSWLITAASTSSAGPQIGYIRFGFSIGSEATINCTQYLEAANGGGGDSAMKATWLGAYEKAASYILGQVASQSPRPTWVPMMTVNMGQSLTTFPGGTDPSWSIGEAQILLANQPFGIGTQGLENGFVGSAVVSDLQSMPSGPNCDLAGYGPCCSDNWCNVRQMVIGNVPVIELQDCNLSTPSGGQTGCLDSALAGTTTADQLTLSQVFTISSQHGTTSAEIYYNDLLCAFDPGALSPTLTTCGNPSQLLVYPPAYANAILALAAGQPSGTSALIGTAQVVGKATMF